MYKYTRNTYPRDTYPRDTYTRDMTSIYLILLTVRDEEGKCSLFIIITL